MFSTRNSLGRNVEINTRGCCFFCLKQVSSSKSKEYSDSRSGNVSTICDLIHYLDLNVEEFGVESSPSSEENNIRGRSPIAVKLCENCVKLSKRISKLIFVKRAVEMEISYYLGSIYQKIFESGRTPSKMRHYYRVMKIYGGNNGGSSITKVENLRKKLSKTCSENFSIFQPRVDISRLSVDLEQLSHLRPAEDCGAATKLYYASTVNTFIPKFEIEPEKCNDDPPPSGFPERECFSEPEIDNDTLASVSPENESSSEPEIHNDPLASLYPEKESSSEPEIDNNAESSLKCTICSGTYTDLPTLNTHMRRVHGKKKLKCAHCSRLFPPISKLYKRHVKKCSISSVYQKGRKTTSEPCKVCSKVYCSAYSLALHYKTVHPHFNYQTTTNIREFKCDICGKIYFEKKSLSIHKASAHFGVRHNCNFPGCFKNYFSQEALVLHWKRKHGELQRPKKNISPPMVTENGRATELCCCKTCAILGRR